MYYTKLKLHLPTVAYQRIFIRIDVVNNYNILMNCDGNIKDTNIWGFMDQTLQNCL